MSRTRQALRLWHIHRVLLRHGLDEIILALHLFRPLRFLDWLSPSRWLGRRKAPRAERIRRALENLGPIFVKAGQIVSTRRDLIPLDIADELAKLQDRVPPFPGTDARRIVETALGRPVAELYAEFDLTPLASASVAQVHTARLPSGEAVVVKVLRENIEPVIRRDIGLLYSIARLAQRFSADARRLRPIEVVAEIEKTILDELDLMREAANAALLKRNFSTSDLLHVPAVYWSHTRRDVMTMERIEGIPIRDIAALRAVGVDFKRLSERGVEIFFTQVFRDNFFHADMHPGNIFVTADGQYRAVDFGIMGTLTTEDQHYLAGNILAFFNRDYRRVAELHVESGWVPRGTRIDEFESAIRTVSEPIFQRPLKEISFGQFLVNLFATARRFDMEIQPQLVLLQKTLLNIEGLGRQLYPELDLWQTAKPFLERWTAAQFGPRAFLRRLRTELPKWSETLPLLPTLLHEVATQARDGRLDIGVSEHDRAADQALARRGNRRVVTAIVASGLLGGGLALLLSAPQLLTPTVQTALGATAATLALTLYAKLLWRD